MADKIDRISELNNKLENLLSRQEEFSREITSLHADIEKLRISESSIKIKEDTEKPVSDRPSVSSVEGQSIKIHIEKSEGTTFQRPADQNSNIKDNLEKFIGVNLINKIGIIITVIGVAIGAKYAIEHQLISPLTRIIIGYLFGIGLLLIAIRLKKNYDNFSAVLLSGAMTIIYFITYLAYSFYSLIPQGLSFVLMIIITAFTVTAAIRYNRQVIAHIGLVGAYAVPFLLSEGAGDITVLFSYTAIINIGILVIAFKKYWKPLYYSSFIFTWLIFLVWFISKYQAGEDFGLALTFLSVFFVTFYLMFLTYKILQQEKFDFNDIILLLANSFIFYGVGYNMLTRLVAGEDYLGLFTLANAVIHSVVSIFIYRQKLADRNLFYFVSGLVLIFLTIAIPVELDGNWVTLLWVGEAALLFWIGRTKGVSFYELLSYGLMFLAYLSLMHDWSPISGVLNIDGYEKVIMPFINIRFLTSMLFVLSFAFINWLNYNSGYKSSMISHRELLSLISFLMTATLLLVLYFSFYIEISTYWDQKISASIKEVLNDGNEFPVRLTNPDLEKFKTIWLLNYSLIFFSILSLVNFMKVKSYNMGIFSLIINVSVLLMFLTIGLLRLSELRDNYLDQSLVEYFKSGSFNIGIRYISLIFVGLLLVSTHMLLKSNILKQVKFDISLAFDLLIYTSVLWIISSELLSWLDIMSYNASYKLALSILWGVYALFLISMGIWKSKKHLRIMAIVIFAVTLLKLFFYDISHLNTISKTIVFVTLGLLLLIISFLYNKYRNSIFSERDET